MRNKKKQNKVLVLLDFDNLYINHPSSSTLFEELNKVLQQIAKEVGPIFKVFVFAHLATANYFADDFYHSQFTTILCPKVKAKEAAPEEDTVDETMRNDGLDFINEMPSLTHLIIGSGDADFLPLVIKAKRTGLDIGLIANSLENLALELIKWADKKPNLNEKMVYLLSSSEKKD